MPGLTSRVLVAVLAVVAGLLFAGLLGVWPRLAGPGAQRVALRVLALCAVQASILCLTFVIVNRINNFYSSWSDLFGRYASGGTLAAVSHGATGSSALVSVLATRSVRVPGRRRAAGTLQTVMIRGELSGLTLDGHIYLPPGYRDGARRPRKYPFILTIAASQRGGASPYGPGRLATSTAMRIVAGQLQPVIVVMLPPGLRSDPGCLNIPGGPQAALFFTQDLRTAIGSRYRGNIQRTRWALLGDKSGGYCALQLALTNAPMFAAVVVPPGSYQTPPGPAAWDGSPQLRQQDDLLWLVRHQPGQPISVLFTGSRTDSPFFSLARAPMRVASAPLQTGLWPLAPALDWLGRSLNADGSS
jgi:enterochelin esterase-like enzyme